MPTGEDNYIELLLKQMNLFEQLAAVRKEKNDLHDAKMRAWDEVRPRLQSNREFDDYWNQAKPAGIDEQHRNREREILLQLDKTYSVLDHLKFAGLTDGRDHDMPVEPLSAQSPAVSTGAAVGPSWFSRIGRNAA